ncbi:MinD/ParA family protein [Myceligenerans halotolerans]
MTKIITIHSYRGGTGKSRLTAGLAAALAAKGRRVLVVDTNIQAPALHIFLGFPTSGIELGLTDYLIGSCEIEQIVQDVPRDRLPAGITGSVQLAPSRLSAKSIVTAVGRGYDPGVLDEGIRRLARRIDVDVMLLDTSAGMTNETMVSLALADALVLVSRPEKQDLEGAGVTMSVVRRLSCPQILLVGNLITGRRGTSAISAIEKAYGMPVSAMFDVVDGTDELSDADLDEPATMPDWYRRRLDELAETLMSTPGPRLTGGPPTTMGTTV